MADDKKSRDSAIEGEGNYTAARAYDRDQKQFAESGKVEPAARKAEGSLERDKAELAKAEAEGRKHSHGEDPALKRQKPAGKGTG